MYLQQRIKFSKQEDNVLTVDGKGFSEMVEKKQRYKEDTNPG